MQFFFFDSVSPLIIFRKSVLMLRNTYVKLRRAELLMKLHLRAARCHLPYGITQCYLPPDTSEHTPP